jgi:hypothetical protein
MTLGRGRLIRGQVEARVTDTTVEIFYKGSRIASHIRWDRERKCPRPRHPGYYRTAAGAIPL